MILFIKEKLNFGSILSMLNFMKPFEIECDVFIDRNYNCFNERKKAYNLL